MTVSRVLRHGGVQVTRQHYIHLRDAKVDRAMAKLAERYGKGTDVSSKCLRKRMRSGDRPGLQNRRAAGILSPVCSTHTRFRH